MKITLQLNSAQVRELADVLGNLGVVFFASLILPTFTGTSIDLGVILSGLMLAIGCVIISLQLLKKQL